MNFKTPFKVLTTAALIGTLSLSAVAPGAASATEKTSQSVKAKEVAANAVDYLVLKNAEGELTKLSFDDYSALEMKYANDEEGFIAALNGFEVAYIVTGNGNVYDLFDFAAAEMASTDEDVVATDLLAQLDEKDAELDKSVIADATDAKVEDGKVVADTPAEEVDFEVTEVAAINPTTVKVNFSKAAESLDKADVTVTDEENAKKFVKSVTLSEDKKSATVEFYDALTEGDYKVAVKDAGEATLKFAVAEAKEIKAETSQKLIPTTGKVDLTQLAYTVLDENGLDITSSAKVTFESTSTVGSDNKVTLADGESTFVYVTVTKKDGTKVKSAKITVTAEDKKVADFGSDWTLAPNTTLVNFESPTYEQDTTLNLGTTEYLQFTAVDQFGKAFTGGYDFKFQTLDASKAVVDETTGKVTPRAEGTAAIKVSLLNAAGDVVKIKTVELDVKAKAEFKDLEVASALDVTTKAPVDLAIKSLDQFGNAIAGQTVKVTSSTEGVLDVPASVTTDANGVINLSVTALKAGTSTLTLKSGDVTKTVSVTVKTPGALADYQVKGFVSNLLVKDDTTTEANDTQMTLAVNGVDADGLVTKTDAEIENATVKVTDAENNEVAITGKTIKASDLTNKKGPFKVVVKVGSVTVLEDTFTLTDNRVAPKYSIKSNSITLTTTNNADFQAEIQKALNFEDNTTDNPNTVQVTDVDFVTSNEEVIEDTDTESGSDSAIDEGSTKIYVDTVTVTKGGDTFVLDLKGEEFSVLVDTEGPTVDTASLELEGGKVVNAAGNLFTVGQGTTTKSIKFVLNEALNEESVTKLTDGYAMLSTSKFGKISVGADKKTIIVTPINNNTSTSNISTGHAGTVISNVAFTVVDKDNQAIAKLKDVLGNEANTPAFKLTVEAYTGTNATLFSTGKTVTFDAGTDLTQVTKTTLATKIGNGLTANDVLYLNTTTKEAVVQVAPGVTAVVTLAG